MRPRHAEQLRRLWATESHEDRSEAMERVLIGLYERIEMLSDELAKRVIEKSFEGNEALRTEMLKWVTK